jgi:hypothetical protein
LSGSELSVTREAPAAAAGGGGGGGGGRGGGPQTFTLKKS